MSDQQLPTGIGRPATRALLSQGLDTLESVAAFGRGPLGDLHGAGPKALRVLDDELAARGLTWA